MSTSSVIKFAIHQINNIYKNVVLSCSYQFFILILYIASILSVNNQNSPRSVRLHLMRMHPFLKHKILSKSMRDLMQVSESKKNRNKREMHNETNGNNEMNPLLMSLKRNIDSIKDPNVNMLLKDLMHDVEDIGCGKKRKLDNVECKINGSWSSEMAGRVIEVIIKANSSNQTAKVHKPLQKSKGKGFMGKLNWNATVRVPFKSKKSFIILTAFDRKNHVVATFMGECMVCRQRDIIQGQWLLSTHARDCESLGATEQLIGDVWRKDHIEALKKHRLEMLKQKHNGKVDEVVTEGYKNSTSTTTIKT